MENLNEQLQIAINKVVSLSDCNCDNGHVFVGYGGEDNTDPIWDACQNCVIGGAYQPILREPILNDVLLAIDFNSSDIMKMSANAFRFEKKGIDVIYNLSKSVFNQSPEVRQQLLDLITK